MKIAYALCDPRVPAANPRSFTTRYRWSQRMVCTPRTRWPRIGQFIWPHVVAQVLRDPQKEVFDVLIVPESAVVPEEIGTSARAPAVAASISHSARPEHVDVPGKDEGQTRESRSEVRFEASN